MVKAEWGSKRTCYSCGAKFYDLRRDPIICPNCETVFDPDRVPRARKGGAAGRADMAGAAVAAGAVRAAKVLGNDLPDEDVADSELQDDAEVDAEDEGDLEELESEDEELIEDTSDLGEDDDDIGEVIEHIDEDVEDKP